MKAHICISQRQERNVFWPNSKCPDLHANSLITLFFFFFSGAKCRICQENRRTNHTAKIGNCLNHRLICGGLRVLTILTVKKTPSKRNVSVWTWRLPGSRLDFCYSFGSYFVISCSVFIHKKKNDLGTQNIASLHLENKSTPFQKEVFTCVSNIKQPLGEEHQINLLLKSL